MWKFVCLPANATQLMDKVESWSMPDIEGPPKPKGKFRNPENFAPGVYEMGDRIYNI
jgi:hypothetical protein